MIPDYQWITWGISAAILAIVVWVNVIWPITRRSLLKRPFSAYFRLPEQSKSDPKPRVIEVPASSNVHVQINRVIRLTHREYMLIMGFEGDEDRRPKIISLENRFVARGKAKWGSPEENENHTVTDKDRYQVKGEEFRVRGNTATVGLNVQTRAPGRYEVYLRTITESGEGRPWQPLTLVVEDPA